MRFSRRTWMAMWLGTLAGCGALELEGGPPPELPPLAAAHLVELEPQVALTRGGEAAPAQLGYLYAQDGLETGPGGKARLRLPAGGQLELGSSSKLAVDAEGRAQLIEGRLRVRDGASAVTPWGVLVTEPAASATLVAADGQAKVDEVEGGVSFAASNGQQVKLVAGEPYVPSVAAVPEPSPAAPDAPSGETADDDAGTPVAEAPAPDAGAALAAVADTAPVDAGAATLLQPIAVSAVSLAGRVEVRSTASDKFKPVGRRSEPVSPGASIRLKDGRGGLLLGSRASRIEFRGGTEMVLQGAQEENGAEVTQLDLSAGELTVAWEVGRPAKLRVGALEVSAAKGGHFVLVKTDDALDLIALAADLAVSWEGKATGLKAGQRARLTGGGQVAIQALSKEALTLPSRAGQLVFHSGMALLSLAWDGPDRDAGYRVEVTSDSSNKQSVLSGWVHEPWVSLAAPTKGYLFWRVYADSEAKPLAQGSARFDAEPKPRDLSRMRNEVSEAKERTTIYYQDKPPALSFTYAMEEAAARYRLQVFRADALDKPVLERTAEGAGISLEAGALGEGEYVWSVTPLSATEEPLRGGKMSRLEVKFDNSVPMLVVESPRQGDGAAESVPVIGTAPKGARLFVNREKTSLDEEGRFSTRAQPEGWPPAVVLQLIQDTGEMSWVVRTLRR